MTTTKIYTATPADLSPPVQSESFCVDMVLASDYRELEAKCAALAVSILEHSGGRMDWRGAMADATELCQTVDSVYAKSPATNAFLAEVRAQGVEMAMEHMQSSGSLTFGDCYISLNEFAAQLRKGVPS